MGRYVLGLQEIDRTSVGMVGGKGASLGELARIDGVRVPPGFCVTTEAFRRLAPGERIPSDVETEVEWALARLGGQAAYAVRSSATAEDLPTASFAGQHDSYLNVAGLEAILEHVQRCWASLDSEHAVSYRRRNGIDDASVRMAVVVQQMVAAESAGVLFTADPITGNRKVATIEAVAGLGDALVSGQANADGFSVRYGRIVGRRQQQKQPTLTDEQAVRLVALGRRIEAHFGAPQDIEWCLAGGEFHVVQSRPITTLFPIPPRDDSDNHVYLSTGHQQMMTDAVKPLGISVWQLTGAVQFHIAAGRWYVDVTRMLATPSGRATLMQTAGKSDPLTGDALQTIIDRDFIPLQADAAPAGPPLGTVPPPIATDAAIVAELIATSSASLAALKRDIASQSGAALFEFIFASFEDRKRETMDPRSLQVIMAGIHAQWWLNDKLFEWIGEKNAADVLTQSLPDNITAQMGLALLDVADVIRPHREVVAFLEHNVSDSFLDALPKLTGGREARDAIIAFLDKYGMRCTGEIDITRPRWSEEPRTLVPAIVANIRNFAHGEAKRRFDRGLQEARNKEREVLARLRSLPDGDAKADEAKRNIDRARTFGGYREYPKYAIVSRYFLYKQALMREAERLARSKAIGDAEDVFFLTIQEFHEAVRTNHVDAALVRERRDAFRYYKTLTPPRLLTSDGEALSGKHRTGALPKNALAGLPVSTGTVEGRARVVLSIADAELEAGDILVTTFTDPSWTAVFVSIRGLVTEVGGLMSHGAVIAREYGLPTVVGVADATRLIRDGQRIRVNATDGYVELL